MPTFDLEDAQRAHPSSRGRTAVVSPELRIVSRPTKDAYDAIRDELDAYYAGMRQYPQLEPDQVMMDLSGMAARLTELRAQLVRDNSQRANALRTKEIDPLLSQIDLQFKLHSRIQAIRQFDWEMSRGQS